MYKHILWMKIVLVSQDCGHLESEIGRIQNSTCTNERLLSREQTLKLNESPAPILRNPVTVNSHQVKWVLPEETRRLVSIDTLPG